MKKLISLIAVCAIALSLCACGTKSETTEETSAAIQTPDVNVYTYMERPNYALSEDYTTDDLREMAIQAMHDELSIQYVPTRFLMYWKLTNSKQNLHTRAPYVVYSGLPYCKAGSSLFSWWEYVEEGTGHFTWPGTGFEMDEVLGNTCANSVCWGWAAVCNTIGGQYSTYYMNQYNGYLPVGDYIYRGGNDYRSYSTRLVCDDNGEQVMYASYAQMHKADAVDATGDNTDVHCMMTITDPVVAYNADGTIDGKNSYVHIQDQRGGTGGYYYTYEDEEGNTLLRVGRVDAVYTFAELFSLGYVPLTNAEFLGTDPCEPSEITLTGDTSTLDGILACTLQSNYTLVNLKLVSVDENGKATTEALKVLHKSDQTNGIAKDTSKVGVSLIINSISREDIEKLANEKTVYVVGDDATGNSVRLAQLPKA